MSTFAALYNEEGNWVASVLTVLQNGGTTVPTANILPAQSVSFATTPRIEIEVEEVGRASAQMAYANGEWYYSHRFATIRADIITQRTGDREDTTSLRFRIEYGILPSVVPTV